MKKLFSVSLLIILYSVSCTRTEDCVCTKQMINSNANNTEIIHDYPGYCEEENQIYEDGSMLICRED